MLETNIHLVEDSELEVNDEENNVKWEQETTEKHKQPSIIVLKERCSEYLQQAYKRNPCRRVISALLKSHFGMGVLL